MTKIQTVHTELLYRSILCCCCCCCFVVQLNWHIIRNSKLVTFYAGSLLFVVVYSKIIFTQAMIRSPWLHQSINSPQVCLFIDWIAHLVKCFGNRTNASHRGHWLFMFSFVLYSVGQLKMKWVNSTDKICMAPYGSCATDWAYRTAFLSILFWINCYCSVMNSNDHYYINCGQFG